MTTSTARIYKIQQKLYNVPESKLLEIDDFIDFMLMKPKISSKRITKFECIRKGLGFEKIGDLESEIRQIRESSTDFKSSIQKSRNNIKSLCLLSIF